MRVKQTTLLMCLVRTVERLCCTIGPRLINRKRYEFFHLRLNVPSSINVDKFYPPSNFMQGLNTIIVFVRHECIELNVT